MTSLDRTTEAIQPSGITLASDIPGSMVRSLAYRARALPGMIGDMAANLDVATQSQSIQSDRRLEVRQRLRSLDAEKRSWGDYVVFHGDMITITARASELPAVIVEQARRLNAEVYKDHIFEPHLYEAALNLLASGRFNGYGAEHPLTQKAQEVLAGIEGDPQVFFARAQERATAEIEGETGDDDMLIIIMQDTGDSLEVVATTKIYSSKPEQPLPTEQYFQVNDYPLPVQARQTVYGEEATPTVEIGRLARKHPMRPIDSIRATVAAYVAMFDHLDSMGMTQRHFEVIANTHSKLITILRTIGLPVDTVPDIDLRPEVMDTEYAPFFVGRLCALLESIEQTDSILPAEDAKRIIALIEEGLDALHHDDRNLSDLKIEMITIPNGTALQRAVAEMREFLDNPVRSKLPGKVRKRNAGRSDWMNRGQELFGGIYGVVYGQLEHIRSYQEMQTWIAQQVMDDDFSGKVLDLGCGRSYVAQALHDIAFQGHYEGCEAAAVMAVQGRARASQLSKDGMPADVQTVKMEDHLAKQDDGSLERVVAAMSLYTLGTWNEQKCVLYMIAQKMQKGGRLVLTNPVPEPDLNEIYVGHLQDIEAREKAGQLNAGQAIQERMKARALGPIIMGSNRKLVAENKRGEIHFPTPSEIMELEECGLHVIKQERMYNDQANCWVFEKK